MKMRRTRGISFILMLVLLVSGFGFMPKKVWAFSIRTSHPGVQGTYYNSGNPFPAKGANCTWYAFGRIYEINGTRPNVSMSHAKDWWGHNIYLQNRGQGYPYGQEPRVGAIACWNDAYNRYGHVAVVEKVENGTVWISESNYNLEAGLTHLKAFDYKRVNAFNTSHLKFQGFIYAGNVNDSSSSSTPQADPLDIGDDFYAYIVNKHTGRYLTKTDEFYVTTTPDLRGERSIWYFYKISGNWYRIQNEYNDKFLDVAWGVAKQGQRIQTEQEHGSGNKAQMWGVYRSKENAYLQSALSGVFTLDENPDTHKVWMWDHHALGAQSFSINVVYKTKVSIDRQPTDGKDLTFTVSNLLPDVQYTAYISGPRSYEVNLSSSSERATKTISIDEAGSYTIQVKSQMPDVKQASEVQSFTVTKRSSSATSNNDYSSSSYNNTSSSSNESSSSDGYSSNTSSSSGNNSSNNSSYTNSKVNENIQNNKPDESNRKPDFTENNSSTENMNSIKRNTLNLNQIISESKYLPNQLTDKVRKEWRIHFNQNIKFVDSSKIYLLDSNGGIYNINAGKVGMDGDGMVVIPLEDLRVGTYYIYIKRDGVLGNKGNMSSSYIMPFNVIPTN